MPKLTVTLTDEQQEMIDEFVEADPENRTKVQALVYLIRIGSIYPKPVYSRLEERELTDNEVNVALYEGLEEALKHRQPDMLQLLYDVLTRLPDTEDIRDVQRIVDHWPIM